MATFLFGMAYIGILIAIASLYLPIAYIAVIYAIAGLVYTAVKQVSLTVEKVRRRGYNISMDTRTVFTGLSSEGAFRALEQGKSVYIVAFQPNSGGISQYSPVGIGAWVDDLGCLYVEPCFATTEPSIAFNIGIAEKQQYILCIHLDWASPERVYLLEDTPSNRAYSLLNAGGYTAIGNKLLVYSDGYIPHFIAEGEVEYLPVKGAFVPPTE